MWFEHPRYVPVRDRLVQALSCPPYRFRRLKPVVFLCGAANSSARDTLKKYLHNTQPELGIFYAEKVWEAIVSSNSINALQMENQLAELADMVVVIVESPGTFTELGAFSVADTLRKKLLPILNDCYCGDQSFIATGPVRWIDMDSDFRPAIYAPLNKILEATAQIESRLRLIKKKSTHLQSLEGGRMHLLFFLCDLVSMIYPTTLQMISAYLSRITPNLAVSEADLLLLLSFAKAMDLLATFSDSANAYYFPARLSLISNPYHHVPKVNFGSYRSEHAAVLQTIPEAAMMLRRVGALL